MLGWLMNFSFCLSTVTYAGFNVVSIVMWPWKEFCFSMSHTYVCAHECIRASCFCLTWENNANDDKKGRRSSFVLGLRWQADCLIPEMSGRRRASKAACTSAAAYTHTRYCCPASRDSPQQTAWSALSVVMQHSSVSYRWIWVTSFPRTLKTVRAQ